MILHIIYFLLGGFCGMVIMSCMIICREPRAKKSPSPQSPPSMSRWPRAIGLEGGDGFIPSPLRGEGKGEGDETIEVYLWP
jgi:hypothetical protein